MKIRNSQSIFKYYFEWVVKCRMSCKFVGGLLYPFFTWIQNQILVSRVFRETFMPLKSSESWIWELKLECNMVIFLYFFRRVSRNGIWIENKIKSVCTMCVGPDSNEIELKSFLPPFCSLVFCPTLLRWLYRSYRGRFVQYLGQYWVYWVIWLYWI